MRGGTEMQTLSLARALLSYKRKVQVLCYFEYDASVVSEFQEAGAEVLLLKRKKDRNFVCLINDLQKEFRRQSPDIIHVQYMAPGALPVIAARLSGVRTVFATVHQPYTKSHGKLAKLLLRFSALLTTKFIAVSLNAEESWFGGSYLYSEKDPYKRLPDHFTIYNAIDINKIISLTCEGGNIESISGIPNEKIIIGAVSRLSREKGINILIEAFEIITNNGFDAFLMIIGAGAEMDRLQKLVSDRGLSKRVLFYGKADWLNAMHLLSEMDIVVVPSLFEGFGLSAAEAMAAGKPVIASDCYGLREVVENGETGYLFNPGDSLDLSHKLKMLLIDKKRRDEFGQKGQLKIKNQFSLNIFSSKILSLYETVDK
jgi:glycosyltransferase involved in cell wall biosynthesis